MEARTKQWISCGIILVLAVSALAVIRNYGSCDAIPQNALLSGGSCTAGMLEEPACPTNDDPVAFPLKELLIGALCVVIFIPRNFLARKGHALPRSLIRWLHAQLPRMGLAQGAIFLPHLFATHGG